MTSQVLEVLRYAFHLAGRGEGRPDAALLERFTTQRDEAAFAALLDRHGPMVIRVCRQVLGDSHDAEDAFQATFLVLARKARSVLRQDSLAAWLHRVALNIALSARAEAARRRARERKAASMDRPSAPAEELPEEWKALLHEEIDRLTDRYRQPVVLCYLQGKTHTEAAAELGWPLGTVKGRLARARGLLHDRLARRGVALTAGGLAAALEGTASANAPTVLLAATLRAALSFAARPTLLAQTVSAHVATLTKGALQAMTMTRLLLLAPLLLALGGLGFGLFLFAAAGKEGPGEPSPAQPEPAKPQVPARDDFGPEVRGLRARITLPAATFEAGAAIPVTYVVKNVSKEEQTLWHSGFWPNHEVLVKDRDGKEPPLTEQGRLCRKAFAPGGERGKNVPVTVPAGGQDTAYEKYDLTKLYDLSKPGRYTVQYVYEEKQGGWQGRLPSNEVKFQVTARAAKEAGMAESQPVRSEGLELVAVVPRRIPAATPAVGRDVALGLRITNVSDRPVTITVFDVVRLWLIDPTDGKKLAADVGRNGSPRPLPPVTLAPGASWRWQPQARLEATADRATLLLRGPDGRGVAGAWSIGTLRAQKYRLVIEYANSSPRQGDVALWMGKATTREVDFEIVRGDLGMLQGTWRLVAAEEGGKAIPQANFGRNTHWVFSGSTGTFKSGLRGLTGTITLDESRDPRWIDLTSGGGFVMRGIYELNGDRLRLFFAPSGAERPTEFRTREGEQRAIHTYERAAGDGP